MGKTATSLTSTAKQLLHRRAVIATSSLFILTVAVMSLGTGLHHADAATQQVYVCPNISVPCTGANSTVHPSNFNKIQDALDAAAVHNTPTVVWVQEGQTFNENLVIKSDNLWLRGAEPGSAQVPGSPKPTVKTTGSSSYGVEVTNHHDIQIRYLDFRVGANDTTLRFHLKVYNTDKLYMRHDNFFGPGKTSNVPVTGMDFNSTSNVGLDQDIAQDYSKNGMAVTAKFDASSRTSANYTLKGDVLKNNGWNGLAFYTHSGPSASGDTSANITGVSFANFDDGTITEIRDNNWSGIQVQGGTDAALGSLANPDKKVTTGAATNPLNVNTVHFSGNFGFDIFNYQTNNVTATSAFFRPIPLPADVPASTVSGNVALKAVQNNKIFDKLDSSNLGTVNF